MATELPGIEPGLMQLWPGTHQPDFLSAGSFVLIGKRVFFSVFVRVRLVKTYLELELKALQPLLWWMEAKYVLLFFDMQ